MNTQYQHNSTFVQLCLCAWMGYALLQAIYIVVIGGSAVFFWMNVTLIGQFILLQYCVQRKRMLASLAMLVSIMGLCFYSYEQHVGWLVLPIVIFMLLALVLYRRFGQWVMVCWILGLVYVLPIQATDLKQLRSHYQHMIGEDSWQQFGTL